jgi:acetyl esterase
MPLHPALQQLIDSKLAHATTPQWVMPIADVRENFRRLWTPGVTGSPDPLPRVEDVTIPTVGTTIPGRVYAGEAERLPVMLYFHGGGYVKGGIDECDAFCRRLARKTRHLVLSVGYRLAPEHPFPAALDDAIAATTWAAAKAQALGAAPGPVVVCGESAGGNLASVACLALRASPAVAIRHQVLLQPVCDFTLSYPSTAMPPTECLVPRPDLAWYYATYAGGRCDFRDPRVSPVLADDLAGSPPALVIAAEYDTLRDEAVAYADKLRRAGVETRCVVVPGMIHGFLQLGALVREASEAIDTIAEAVSPVNA